MRNVSQVINILWLWPIHINLIKEAESKLLNGVSVIAKKIDEKAFMFRLKNCTYFIS